MSFFGYKTKDSAQKKEKLTLAKSFERFAAQKGNIKPNEMAARLSTVILEYAVRCGASDIHFDPNGHQVQVRFRIDGILYDQVNFSNSDFPVPARLRVMANFPPKAGSLYTPEDGRFGLTIDGRDVQFRASAFPTIDGNKLVLRILDMGKNTLNLDHLGFKPSVLSKLKDIIHSPSGIMVVSGMTGSGKTTTLCSILKELSCPETNTMTLEEPIEYQIPRVIHSQIDPRKGFTFAEGLRAILRQDPNVIMVGEMRDRETAEVALRAAMTGHLIFSTVHATSTTAVINRLIGMEIEPYMITSALVATLAQRLVRITCAACMEKTSLNTGLLDTMIRNLDEKQVKMIREIVGRPGGKFLKARGCVKCNNTGYKGRLGLYEFLVINDKIRSLIKKNHDVVALEKAAIDSGMETLLMDGLSKVWAGRTTLEEVHRVVA